MLNSTSFSQLAPQMPRAGSQTSKSRHRRGQSQGRRPKAERVVSMSRTQSYKSDGAGAGAGETAVSMATPNWTKNEKYCITRLPGRPSQIDNIAQFRTHSTPIPISPISQSPLV
jgi:hypothetical protein